MDESEQAVEDRSGDLREHLPGDEDAEQREDRIPGEPADGDGRALGHETAEHGGAVQRRGRQGILEEEEEGEEQGDRGGFAASGGNGRILKTKRKTLSTRSTVRTSPTAVSHGAPLAASTRWWKLT